MIFAFKKLLIPTTVVNEGRLSVCNAALLDVDNTPEIRVSAGIKIDVRDDWLDMLRNDPISEEDKN